MSRLLRDTLEGYSRGWRGRFAKSLGGSVARGFESHTFLKNSKGDKIMKEIVLDESILDIDKWLPQEAIDQLAELICYLDSLDNE